MHNHPIYHSLQHHKMQTKLGENALKRKYEAAIERTMYKIILLHANLILMG